MVRFAECGECEWLTKGKEETEARVGCTQTLPTHSKTQRAMAKAKTRERAKAILEVAHAGLSSSGVSFGFVVDKRWLELGQICERHSIGAKPMRPTDAALEEARG